MSVYHQSFNEACDQAGLPRNQGKQLIHACAGGMQGGEFCGRRGVLKLGSDKLRNYIQLSLALMARRSWNEFQMRHWSGETAFMATFRRPMFSGLAGIFPLIEKAKDGEVAPHAAVVDEIMTLCVQSPLSQTNLRAILSPEVSCTDASPSGGGSCSATAFKQDAVQIPEKLAFEGLCGQCGGALDVGTTPGYDCPNDCGFKACCIDCFASHRHGCAREMLGRASFGERFSGPNCPLTKAVALAGVFVQPPLDKLREGSWDFFSPLGRDCLGRFEDDGHLSASHRAPEWKTFTAARGSAMAKRQANKVDCAGAQHSGSAQNDAHPLVTAMQAEVHEEGDGLVFDTAEKYPWRWCLLYADCLKNQLKLLKPSPSAGVFDEMGALMAALRTSTRGFQNPAVASSAVAKIMEVMSTMTQGNEREHLKMLLRNVCLRGTDVKLLRCAENGSESSMSPYPAFKWDWSVKLAFAWKQDQHINVLQISPFLSRIQAQDPEKGSAGRLQQPAASLPLGFSLPPAGGHLRAGAGKKAAEISEAFRELPSEEKEKLRDQAAEAFSEYEERMKEWKSTDEGKKYMKETAALAKRRRLATAKEKFLKDEPKRPPSAVALFRNEKRSEYASQFPDLKGLRLNGKLSEIYRGLPEEEKKVYEDMAKEKNDEYLEQIEEFQKSAEYKKYLAVAKPKAKPAGKAKAVKKETKKGPPIPDSMPKKPPKAMNLFMAANKGGGGLAEQSKAWKELGEEGQKKYIEEAKDKVEEYEKELEDFKKTAEGKKYYRLKAAADKKSRIENARAQCLGGEDAPKAPKPAHNAYQLFVQEKRPALQAEKKSLGEIAKELSAMWGKCSEEEKQPYEEQAKKSKEEYDEAMKEYKSSEGYKKFEKRRAAIEKKPKPKGRAKAKSKTKGNGRAKARAKGKAKPSEKAADSDSDSDVMGSDSDSTSSSSSD
eukprot:s240_g36.t1